MREVELAEVQAAQSGVVSRRQVLEHGGNDNDIERLLRRRLWARVHPGVYVDHTGPLTWMQRAWAAVVVHWPAALGGTAALFAHGVLDREPTVIEVVVDRKRRVDDPPGVRTRQVRRFDDVALMNLGPPRVRVEHAAVGVAARADADDAAAAILGQTVQRRRSTATRLQAELEHSPTLPRRRLLAAILDDVAAGTNSALERRFLVDVERAHGLPVGDRQQRVVNGRRSAYRDVYHEAHGAVFELDGRLGHSDTNDRWADLQRDVSSAIAGDLTVRLGWGQVLRPCRLAAALAAILCGRGWEGRPQPCGPECELSEWREESASGAGDPRSSGPTHLSGPAGTRPG